MAASLLAAAPAGAASGDCDELSIGTTGFPELVAGPTIDLVRDSGTEALVGAPAPAGLLPDDRIYLRTLSESFNSTYEFAARGGQLYVRSIASDRGWHRMPLPACFAGRVAAISADGPFLAAADAEGRIFTMDNANREPLLWSWTSRWGPPLWVNFDGQRLPRRLAAWQLSVLSSVEDETWTDPAGNEQSVGGGDVTTIYALRGDRRRITILDPWLPNDYSYEVCGPRHGRLKLRALSASGSTLFVTDRFGDLYTRLWDFDISGADTVFFRYSYEDQRGKEPPIVPVPNYVPTGIDGLETPPIQLPAPGWVRQPKIRGQITDRISISKSGPGSDSRALRVEGRRKGRSGYWEKPNTARSSKAWSFHPTGGALVGRWLANPRRDRSGDALAKPAGRTFSLRDAGLAAQIRRFNPVCTPSPLVLGRGKAKVRLTLHTIDGLRQEPRATGLDDEPRIQLATIEVPGPILRRAAAGQLPEPVGSFIRDRLGSRRFTETELSATATELRFGDLGLVFR